VDRDRVCFGQIIGCAGKGEVADTAGEVGRAAEVVLEVISVPVVPFAVAKLAVAIERHLARTTAPSATEEDAILVTV
jgi:hypothetical protein